VENISVFRQNTASCGRYTGLQASYFVMFRGFHPFFRENDATASKNRSAITRQKRDLIFFVITVSRPVLGPTQYCV
jgi:hypothetical protein